MKVMAPKVSVAGLSRLIAEKDYAALEELLAAAPLADTAQLWTQLEPMQKLVCFKVMDAPRAFELYEAVSFNEQYFLLCGFPLQSIAPVLEGLTPIQRRVFVQLPRDFYDRMFRILVKTRAELDVPIRPN
jgi:Mg/Co/Ni transporter MgtE